MNEQRLYDYLTPTIKEYVNSLDFDVYSFLSNPNNNIYSTNDINPIIGDYGVFDYSPQMVNISIADIVGHDDIYTQGYYSGKNILHSFRNFFERNSDGYHTRGLGLLDYKSGDELLKGLKDKDGFKEEIKVRNVENNKFVISGNGLHRYSVLRFHYLLDLMKGKESEEELRNKYTFPAVCNSKTNLFFTYCNFLLQKTYRFVDFISFDKEDNSFTIYNIDGSIIKNNLDSLLPIVISSISTIDDYALMEVTEKYNDIESFHVFVDQYLPMLKEKMDNKEDTLIW